MPIRRLLVLLAVVTFSLDAPSTNAWAQPTQREEQSKTHESWQVIYVGNQRIGYQHGRERLETRDGRKVVVTDSQSFLTIKRFGQELKMSTALHVEETESGELLRFSFQLKNPPIQDTTVTGVVTGKDLELTTKLAGKTDTRRIAWETDARSPAYPDRVLRGQPLQDGETKSFKVYLPEFGKFSLVSFAAEGLRPVKLLDGKEHSLMKMRVSFSAIPEYISRQYVTAQGELKLSETDMLGLVARAYEVPSEVALQAIAGEELDVAISSLVRVDPPILDAHRKQKIVYRISMSDESPEPYFIAGGTQQIKRLPTDGQQAPAIELTVTSKPIPPANSRPVSTDAKYLGSSRYLQSRDPAVVEHADRAAGGETDPCRIATRLEKYVHEKLKRKNFSTAMASAAEVAQRMEGDCTEHAMLLAAMLRAKKIPSRIATGLVYVDSLNAFGGHMWTEAFLAGEWIPLDGTLGRGGVGPAHLKMADSALDEDAPLPVTTFLPAYKALGKLKISLVTAE
jgi:hypothetical protein